MFSARKQDLPPNGGYEKIIYQRNPGRVLFKGRYFLLAGLGMQLTGLYLFHFHHKYIVKNRVERQGGLIASYPFLLAERDRAYLKQLHFFREEEEKAMKNIEGWETGTYYGEPIYKTVNPDEEWIDPGFEEFYSGIKPSDWEYNAGRRFYC